MVVDRRPSRLSKSSSNTDSLATNASILKSPVVPLMFSARARNLDAFSL